MCNFGRGYQEDNFCEIILNLDQWFRSCGLKIFLMLNSGGPFVQWSGTICAIFGRGLYEEQFCEIILNLYKWFRRRCLFKIFIMWSSGSPFVQRSGSICAILVESVMRNNSVI